MQLGDKNALLPDQAPPIPIISALLLKITCALLDVDNYNESVIDCVAIYSKFRV